MMMKRILRGLFSEREKLKPKKADVTPKIKFLDETEQLSLKLKVTWRAEMEKRQTNEN